jgi:hypothetical protein
VLDVDGNGTPDALTDGILILRYLFDPAGDWNYSDALGTGATRTSRSAIRAYLDLYEPAAAASAMAGAMESVVVEEAAGAQEADSTHEAAAVAGESRVAEGFATVASTLPVSRHARPVEVAAAVADGVLRQWNGSLAGDARLARLAAWIDLGMRRADAWEGLFDEDDGLWFTAR